MQVKQFSQLGISTKKSFIGTSLMIEQILEKDIIIKDFKIEDSNKKPGTKCLTIQLSLGGNLHVIFTGSTVLMDQIRQVSEEDFPFQAQIIKVHRHYEFK